MSFTVVEAVAIGFVGVLEGKLSGKVRLMKSDGSH